MSDPLNDYGTWISQPGPEPKHITLGELLATADVLRAQMGPAAYAIHPVTYVALKQHMKPVQSMCRHDTFYGIELWMDPTVEIGTMEPLTAEELEKRRNAERRRG